MKISTRCEPVVCFLDQIRRLAVQLHSVFDPDDDHIPKNWIIWIDDPDIQELIDIKPAAPPSLKAKKEKLDIDGTRYDVRPEELSLGLPLKDHRCIYTTTEQLTVRKLKHLLAGDN